MGTSRSGPATPFTVTCIAAGKSAPNGTAKLIWVEETYSSGAATPPKLTLTPASLVVELSAAPVPAAGPSPAPKTVSS